MKREEILAKSRKENKGADLAEFEANRRAQGIAGAVVIFVCATLNLIGMHYTDYRFPELWALTFLYGGTQGVINWWYARKQGSDKAVMWALFGVFLLFCSGKAVFDFIAALKAGQLG